MDKEALRKEILAAVVEGTADGTMSPTTRATKLDRVLQSVEREEKIAERKERDATRAKALAEAKKDAARAA